MARPTIPDALRMRTLKYEESELAERERVAETLRGAKRHTEALLLYEGRASDPSLRHERDRALSEGQSFRLFTLRKLGMEITPAHVRTCAESAERHGRWMDARLCWKDLGNDEAIQRIAPHLPPSLQPPPPPPPPAAPALPTAKA